MLPERRRAPRPAHLAHEGTADDIVLARSRRLIAEIDALLERSQELMAKQALLHRSWR